MLTVITPTGERSQAFALCQRMMARQDYLGPVYWIVVDDGREPATVTLQRDNWTVVTLRPQPLWSPGEITQGRNLVAGLDEAERAAREGGYDLRLTVVEDDDWYSPQWFSHVDRELNKAELVGEGQALYYNVRSRRYSNLRNYVHASLRCSAMRGGALSTFRQVLGRFSRYYDFDLWKAHQKKHVFSSNLTVGMKGMPGRAGIAVGHDLERGSADPGWRRLREWIGDDADWYKEFYEERPMIQPKPTKKMMALRDFKYAERGLIKKGQTFSLRPDAEEAGFIACGRAIPVDAAPPAKPQPPKRTLKIEHQEAKVAEAMVQKAPEPEKQDEATPAAEVKPEETELPAQEKPRFESKRTFSRK